MVNLRTDILAIFIIVLSCLTLLVKGVAQLKSYSLLLVEDVEGFVHQRYKRSVNQRNVKAIQDLKFNLFDRKFNLKLVANRDIYSPHFKTILIKQDGTEEEVGDGVQDIYRGVLAGEPSSDVHLHLEDHHSSTFVAKIETESETYYIEPAKGHKIVTTTEIQDTMLAYKASDFIYSDDNGDVIAGTRTAYSPIISISDHNNRSKSRDAESNGRSKRAVDDQLNTCSINLYADYKFFKLHYDSVESTRENRTKVAIQRTKYYVIDLLAWVDSIYRKTVFSIGETVLRNHGFSIKRVYIHDSPSTNSRHYNYEHETKRGSTAAHDLLDAFSVTKYRPYGEDEPCLSHLFTAYSFIGGTLGEAAVASPDLEPGGICSIKFAYDEKLGSYLDWNIGWTTAINRHGQTILMKQAEITLAHEIGHNFGSNHDPPNEQCSPGGVNGNFLMQAFAVQGNSINNQLFSPCSRSSIAKVLKHKKHKCFEEKTTVLSDNYRVDPGEECDEGPGGGICCDSENKYKNGGDCSTVNDQCCVFKAGRCTYRGVTDICQEALSDASASCLKESRCSGTSKNCTLTYKEYKSKCQNGYGRCMTRSGDYNKTVCEPFLKSIGLTSCTCDEEANQCVECYLRNSICNPFDRTNVPDLSLEHQQIYYDYTQSNDLKWENDRLIALLNTPCAGGLCTINTDTSKLECEKMDTDLVARFWKFLSQLDTDAAVEFMRDNIVGTILVFSVMLWLPCVIAIHCVDKKRRKREKQMKQALTAWRASGHSRAQIFKQSETTI